MKELTNGWTRRKFLNRVGQVAGAAALYEVMVAMGMVNLPTAWEGPPTLKADIGKGKSVLILGAGIGGLTTAYLLSQYGYRCEILEASARAGGRNHTARRGSTVIEEEADGTQTTQVCKFDSGLYMNLGPGRLPYHHRRVLGYCQALEVKLEPYIMNTTGNLFQTEEAFEGNPMVYRKIQNDTKGYIAELLAKAIRKGALDEELTEDDWDNINTRLRLKQRKDKLYSLLQVFGPLDKCDTSHQAASTAPLKYNGSTRDGCGTSEEGPTPNVYYNCSCPEKLELSELLDANFWKNSFYDPTEFEWQATLFQPTGGMDMIVEGFLRKVGHLIKYNAPVVGIEATDNGVSVTYKDGSQEVTKMADYCVSNIPCPILSGLNTNFDGDFKLAVDRTDFDGSCKVGWQTNTRFWESNKNEIYGGISWTDDIIEQIWYPSNDYFGQKGTLTGAYIHNKEGCNRGNAEQFGKLSLEERLERAKAGGEKLHPEFKDNSIVPIELGMSIAWQKVQHQKGAWPCWGNDQHDDRDYMRLLRPFRNRFFVVGDQASTLPGWQEGAMMSAEHVVELIGGIKTVEDIPTNITAPNTMKVLQGHG